MYGEHVLGARGGAPGGYQQYQKVLSCVMTVEEGDQSSQVGGSGLVRPLGRFAPAPGSARRRVIDWLCRQSPEAVKCLIGQTVGPHAKERPSPSTCATADNLGMHMSPTTCGFDNWNGTAMLIHQPIRHGGVTEE